MRRTPTYYSFCVFADVLWKLSVGADTVQDLLDWIRGAVRSQISPLYPLYPLYPFLTELSYVTWTLLSSVTCSWGSWLDKSKLSLWLMNYCLIWISFLFSSLVSISASKHADGSAVLNRSTSLVPTALHAPGQQWHRGSHCSRNHDSSWISAYTVASPFILSASAQ